MPGSHQEFIGVWMLGPAVIVAQAAQIRSRQVHRHVVRRVGQRPAEVAGLRVVAQQHQRHAGQKAGIFHAGQIARRHQRLPRHMQSFDP